MFIPANRCHTSRSFLNRPHRPCRSWRCNSFPQYSPHIMHLARLFALCCLFSIGALGLVRATTPDFGPNVMIFDPSMPTSQIQKAVDAIANQQISNQFGPQRYALLFMPGTYGTSDTPLNFQVGYYTAVAGLGSSPKDDVINRSISVYNQGAASDS